MKKGIIILVIILVIAFGIFLVYKNSSDIQKLEKEVEYFVKNKVAKAEIVTKGETAKIETLLKEDFKKAEDVAESIESTSIEKFIELETYAKNEIDFAESKLSLQNMKSQVDKDIAELKEIINEEEQNTKIALNDLSEASAKKYKELLEKSKIEDVINALNEEKEMLAQKISFAETIVNNFLNNKDKWEIIDNELKFLDEDFKAEYNKLVNEFKSIIKK